MLQPMILTLLLLALRAMSPWSKGSDRIPIFPFRLFPLTGKSPCLRATGHELA